MITSRDTRHWIFPKGIVEPGQSLEEAALNEALEEAGLHGRLVGESLGTYDDTKWGTTLRVTVLMMEVSGCDDSWLEASVRQRRWVSPDQAVELLSKPVFCQFVEAALKLILKK
jgi:8-oxo-dGTP pyrophosphatase MutT (NUDIX family)